jgi:hypothetical protein
LSITLRVFPLFTSGPDLKYTYEIPVLPKKKKKKKKKCIYHMLFLYLYFGTSLNTYVLFLLYLYIILSHYYNLDLKYSPNPPPKKPHVFRRFRRWGLGERGHWGHALEGYIGTLASSSFYLLPG